MRGNPGNYIIGSGACSCDGEDSTNSSAEEIPYTFTHVNMKSQLCLLLAFFTAALAAPAELTAEEVSALQIDRILSNEELVKGYFDCVMDKGPCDPAGEALKSLLPKWFDSECSTCNERQKENISKIVKFAKDNKAELYEQIEKKFKSLES